MISNNTNSTRNDSAVVAADDAGRRSSTTKGDATTNNVSSILSGLDNLPRPPRSKRNKTISFKTEFEQIFMDAGNHQQIFQLFDKKDLTLTEKKHIDNVVEAFVLREFANVHESQHTPTLRSLIHMGESRQGKNLSKYIPGDWVEVIGYDMKWRLHYITKVVKQPTSDYNWKYESSFSDQDGDWVYTYHAGVEKNLPEHRLRAPYDGLKALFGLRPWLWQQWAMLKLEEKMRFQENHQDDFMIMSAQRYAMQIWNEWLDHPKNQDFKTVFYNDHVGDFGRAELMDHILHPFVLMDELTAGDGDWNLKDDQDVSVYTYQSLTGAYSHISLVVFLIQVTIPAILAFDITKTFVECSQYQAYVPQVCPLLSLYFKLMVHNFYDFLFTDKLFRTSSSE